MLTTSKAFASFSVNDLTKAKEFYGTVLGLDINERPEGLELKLAGRETPTFIYPKPDYTAATYTILNFPVDNIEATVDELTSKGVQFEQYNNEWMKTDSKGISRDTDNARAMAWFKDPAGNFLSLIETRNL